MVNGVKKVLTAIKPENIQTVKVYSKQSGDDFPKWHEEFELAEKKKVDSSRNNDLAQSDVTNQQKIENSEVEILSEEKTSSMAMSDSDIALEYIVENINNTFRQNGLTISVSTTTIPSIVNGYLEITVVSRRPLREESETIKNIIINTIENELNNPSNEYFDGVNLTFISLRGKEYDDSWTRELYRKPQVQASQVTPAQVKQPDGCAIFIGAFLVASVGWIVLFFFFSFLAGFGLPISGLITLLNLSFPAIFIFVLFASYSNK